MSGNGAQEHPSTFSLEGLDIVLTHAAHTGLGINLRRGDAFMAQELLDLLQVSLVDVNTLMMSRS